jgi:hypothetical protein
MRYTLPELNWTPITCWQTVNLIGFNAPGLLRFRLNGETVFLVYAGSPNPGVVGRIMTYRRGGTPSQEVGQLILENRDLLELEVVLLDLPRKEIRDLYNSLLRQSWPVWNKKTRYHGHD